MIEELAKKLDFPKEAVAVLRRVCQELHRDDAVRNDLYRAMDLFYEASDEVYPILQKTAERTGINRYSVDMVFLLLCARPLRYIYRQKGLPEALYYDTLQDLRYKLLECKKLHNVWGTFVIWWYPGFYLCKRFQLGRLQYERTEFPYDDGFGIIKKGDTVYNCHIPSSGPLQSEAVLESLKQAHTFYRAELKNGILPVYCSSWLLYPPHAACYPSGSHLRAFYDMFHILNFEANPSNRDFWRVFYTPFSETALQNAPEQTTLQRNLKRYLLQGNCMGNGKGILFFDGERIIK